VEGGPEARVYAASLCNTEPLAGTGCAEQTNAVRQACGGSEARMTWHETYDHAADEGMKQARRPLLVARSV